MNPTENNKEKPSGLFVEKDVLGLEKPHPGNRSTGHPKRILIVFLIAVVIGVIAWLISHNYAM